MLQKPKLSAGLMGHLARMQTLPTLYPYWFPPLYYFSIVKIAQCCKIISISPSSCPTPWVFRLLPSLLPSPTDFPPPLLLVLAPIPLHMSGHCFFGSCRIIIILFSEGLQGTPAKVVSSHKWTSRHTAVLCNRRHKKPPPPPQ